MIASIRPLAIVAIALFGYALGVTATAAAEDKENEFPTAFQGTWLLRLTSDDGGKTYKAGDNMPVCEVSGKEVKFSRKVDFSDEKLAVKSVTKTDAKGSGTYLIEFENEKTWKLSEISGSITAIIHDSQDGKLTEKYRITVRKKK